MGSNAKTGVAAAAKATPRVGTRLLVATNFQTSTSSSSSTSQTPRRPTVKMAVSKIRQNYHEDCEALINKQIKTESGEERAHGMKLMEYQTKRGGRVVFQDVAKP